VLRSDKSVVVRLLSCIILVYVAIVLFINLTEVDYYLISFAPSLGGLKIGYSGFLGLLSVFLGVALFDTLRTSGVRVLRLYRSMNFILVPFGLVGVLTLVCQLHPDAYWGELQGSALFPFWPFINFFIMLFAASFAAIPSVIRYHRWIFILSLTALTLAILYDYFARGVLSETEGRAAGFAVDPNTSAEILLALTVISVDWKKFTMLDGIIWLIAGIGISPTFSRQGILIYLLALGLYLVFTVRARPQAKTLLQVGVFAVLFAAAFIYMYSSDTLVFEGNQVGAPVNAKHRLEEFAAIAGGDLSSIVNDQRSALYPRYTNLIAQAPILGHGAGLSYGQGVGQGPHNIYLRQWSEDGVLGVVLLLMFLSASFLHFKRYKHMGGMAFVTLFALLGLFSHTLLDERPFLVMFGFLGALAYVAGSESFRPPSSVPKAWYSGARIEE
jgi:O-antigen ligase